MFSTGSLPQQRPAEPEIQIQQQCPKNPRPLLARHVMTCFRNFQMHDKQQQIQQLQKFAMRRSKFNLTGVRKVDPEGVSLSKFTPAIRAFVLSSYCLLNARFAEDVAALRLRFFNQLAHADYTCESRCLGLTLRHYWSYWDIACLP